MGNIHRLVGGLGFVTYMSALTMVVFWPTPVDTDGAPALRGWLVIFWILGTPKWIGYAQVEWLANVVMFVPLGIFCAFFVSRKGVILGAAAGLLAAVAIETIQSLFLPGRYGSILDVVANTLGAVGGASLAVPLKSGVLMRFGGKHSDKT